MTTRTNMPLRSSRHDKVREAGSSERQQVHVQISDVSVNKVRQALSENGACRTKIPNKPTQAIENIKTEKGRAKASTVSSTVDVRLFDMK